MFFNHIIPEHIIDILKVMVICLKDNTNLFENVLGYANKSFYVMSNYEPWFWFINPPFLLLEVEFHTLSEFFQLQLLGKILSNIIQEKQIHTRIK